MACDVCLNGVFAAVYTRMRAGWIRWKGSKLIPGSVKSAEGDKLRTQFKAPAEEVKLFSEELPSNPRFPSKTCSDQIIALLGRTAGGEQLQTAGFGKIEAKKRRFSTVNPVI